MLRVEKPDIENEESGNGWHNTGETGPTAKSGWLGFSPTPDQFFFEALPCLPGTQTFPLEKRMQWHAAGGMSVRMPDQLWRAADSAVKRFQTLQSGLHIPEGYSCTCITVGGECCLNECSVLRLKRKVTAGPPSGSCSQVVTLFFPQAGR